MSDLGSLLHNQIDLIRAVRGEWVDGSYPGTLVTTRHPGSTPARIIETGLIMNEGLILCIICIFFLNDPFPNTHHQTINITNKFLERRKWLVNYILNTIILWLHETITRSETTMELIWSAILVSRRTSQSTTLLCSNTPSSWLLQQHLSHHQRKILWKASFHFNKDVCTFWLTYQSK